MVAGFFIVILLAYLLGRYDFTRQEAQNQKTGIKRKKPLEPALCQVQGALTMELLSRFELLTSSLPRNREIKQFQRILGCLLAYCLPIHYNIGAG